MNLLPDLESTFGAWLHTSIAASVMAAMVLLFRRLSRGRVAPAWHHTLGCLVLVRLALPWAPASDWSLFRWLPPRPHLAQSWPAKLFPHPSPNRSEPLTPPPAPTPSDPSDPSSRRVVLPDSPHPSVPSPTLPPTLSASPPTESSSLDPVLRTHPEAMSPAAPPSPWTRAAAWSWILGALALLTHGALRNSWFLHRLRHDRQPVDAACLALLRQCARRMRYHGHLVVWETGLVSGPAVFGLFRPRLLLPRNFGREFGPEALRHVLLHELAHLRRRDPLTHAAATLLAALHWFNPIVWLTFRRLRQDRELAADALALDCLPESETRAYGHTIVRLLERWSPHRPQPAVLGILEDAHPLAERIHAISRHRRTARHPWWGTLFLVVFAGVTLTNGRSAEPLAPYPAPPSAPTPAIDSPTPTPPAPIPSTSPTPTLGGRVLDETGQPVPEAEVQIGQRGPFADPSRGNNSVTVKTDAQGRWSTTGAAVEPGILTLRITHPDCVTAWYQETDNPNPTARSVRRADLRSGSAVFRLGRGRSLHGTVLGPDAAPAANAQVRYAVLGAGPIEIRTTETDAQGRFRLVLFDTGTVGLGVDAPHAAPYEGSFQIGPGLGLPPIHLAPARTLRGRVTDARGPVSGATVGVLHVGIHEHLMNSLEWLRTYLRDRGHADLRNTHRNILPARITTTGPDGSFLLADVPRENLVIGIEAPNMEPRQIPVRREATNEIAVALAPIVPGFVGRVLDARTGDPLSHFTVWQTIPRFTGLPTDPIPPPAPEDETWMRADLSPTEGEGRFEIRGQPLTRVLVLSEGYAAALSPLLAQHETRDHAFLLHKHPGLRGRLLTVDGAPAANARVAFSAFSDLALYQGRLMSSRGIISSVAADGTFHIPAILTNATLVAAHPDHGYLEFNATDLDLAAGPPLRLQRWGSVSGRIPATDARRTNHLIRLYPSSTPNTAILHSSLNYETHVAANGSFALGHLPPGLWRIQLGLPVPRGSPGFRFDRMLALRSVDVRPGVDSPVDFNHPGRTLIGRVQPSVPGRITDWNNGVFTLASAITPTPRLPSATARDPSLEAARQAELRTHRAYGVEWLGDGRFQIRNVEPGNYRLDLHFYESTPPSPFDPTPIPTAALRQHAVTVGPAPPGSPSDPLDLGDLPIEFIPRRPTSY